MNKHLILSGLFAGFVSLTAQAAFERELIAGWDFSPASDINSETDLIDWEMQKVVSGSTISIDEFTHPDITNGTIYWNGQFGSSGSMTYGNVDDNVGGTQGTTSVNRLIVNRPIGTQFSDLDGGGVAPEALGFFDTDGAFTIHIPAMGLWEDFQVTYAGKSQASSANSVAWSYSTDGVNFTSVGGGPDSLSTSYTLKTVNLTGITALAFADNVYLRASFSGVNNAGSIFEKTVAFDNIQVSGIIPEPSTYAILAGVAALGLVALRRRRA